MTDPNRYDDVADLYDLYVDVVSDLDFFRAFAEGVGGPVLDLMAGTGRVSMGLAGGANLVIALERSEPMLQQLKENTDSPGRNVSPLCADARAIPLEEEAVDLVLLPFNSFSELLTSDAQTSTLRDIARCLRSGGRFVGTLHNPRIRARSLDGRRRLQRRRPLPSSRGRFLELWVEGTLDQRTRIAESNQLLQIVDESGAILRETTQCVRFMLLEPEAFVRMAERVGLCQVETFGGYDRTPFEPGTSPYFISVFEKLRKPT